MLSRDGSSDFDPEFDYIRAQIKKLIEFCKRVVAEAEADEQIDLSLEALRGAADDHLGVPGFVLDKLTAEAAAALLRQDEKLRGYAAVCATESELLYKRRRFADSEKQASRAAALYGALLARNPEDDEAALSLRALQRSRG